MSEQGGYEHPEEGKLFHDIRSSLTGKMVEEVSYHSSHCRGLLVDQSTGELSFNHTEFKDNPSRHPVGQFIGAKPISEDCESFSIEIVNSMTSSEYIGLGLCHRKYDPDSMVGWDDNSIGYHADDGGICHEFPFPKDGCQFGYVGDEDVMTCSFDFHEKTVTFLRNGIKVFTSMPLQIPLGGYYPMVCLGINGQIVRLLETQSWLPATEIVSLSQDLVFHSLYCREANISQASGIVRYHSLSPDIPVGQFVSRCSLSPQCNKFSAEIVSLGQKSCISIEVCHRCYPSNSQTGWLPNSIAYHVDDGGIYHENGMTLCEGLKARAGDILSCEIDFSTRTWYNEIVNPMTKSINIGLGLCHRKYYSGRMAGWDQKSIGYHADNGAIYGEFGSSRKEMRFGKVGLGEVMECSFDFDENTVTFLLNGIQVFTSRALQIPSDEFYPIVCLGSNGQVVRLLQKQPWTPDTNIAPMSNDVVFHSLYCREARISHSSGIVRYHSLFPDIPVGQFVSKCPLSPECNKFSVEIASLGQKSCISVGVCHRCYPSNCQPGWLPNSIAYHADDGGLHNGTDNLLSKGPMALDGDTISCEFDFSSTTVIVRRNGVTILRSPPVTVPPGGFHAAVGFHSPGEAVCLLEKDPWRSEMSELYFLKAFKLVYNSTPQTALLGSVKLHSEFEDLRLFETEPLKDANIQHPAVSAAETTPDKPIISKCCICMEKGVTRFLIPCGHTFCVDCVEQWTTDHDTCPACRVRYQDVKIKTTAVKIL